MWSLLYSQQSNSRPQFGWTNSANQLHSKRPCIMVCYCKNSNLIYIHGLAENNVFFTKTSKVL